MSPEFRVLFEPEATFAALIASREEVSAGLPYVWRLVRRPLLLMFAMGFALSLSSSDRLSVRATVDGMISFAFLPATEVLAAAVLLLRTDRRLSFARFVDIFFVSNAPWLLWVLVFCASQAFTRPLAISLTGATSVLATLVVPAVWAFYLDSRLLRVVSSRRGGAGDLVVSRVVGWTLALTYFFGIAVWAQIVAWVR